MDLRKEVELWKSFLRGDKDAFAAIYELYSKSLYRYGLYITSSTEEIEDAMHDLFVNLYRNHEHLPMIDNVKGYLIISLKNILLKEYNRKKIGIGLDDVNAGLILSPDSTIEDVLVEKEQLEEDNALLNELKSYLTEREQEAVYYRFVHQLAYKEIAERMGIQEQSAKNMIHTSLRKLRSKIPYVVLIKLWISFL